MKAIIIEDEKAAVRNLMALLRETAPDVEVIEVIDSIADAINWFEAHPMPGLVFMDIHLADGSAFEIFDHICITCPIIFTTAYDEYALKAFKVNSIDYLLKPIGEEDMKKALDKLQNFHGGELAGSKDLREFINYIRKEESYKTHFLVPVKGDKLLPVSVDMVSYFYINGGEVKVMLSNGKEYLLPQTLDELTECLNPSLFFRVNRQYLISREAVKDIDLWFNNRLSINLRISSSEKILVSRAKVAEFKEWFETPLSH